MKRQQHPPLSWFNIITSFDWETIKARLKLLKIKNLEHGEACPMPGCAYHICNPCPACGRHMAHGKFILGHYSKCLMHNCLRNRNLISDT